MKYEFEIISNITTKGPKPKTLIKDDKIKKLFDLDTIELEEYVDIKGNHIKKYCSICQNNVWHKVNKPYEQVKALILNRTIPMIGFMAKSKLYEKAYKNKIKSN